MPEGHDPYLALRNPSYRRLLMGNILGSIGFGMQFLAVEWELYQRTHSAAALGFVGLVQFVPVLVLAIPAGHLADRINRKWFYTSALALMACASVGLTAVSYLVGPVWLIYLCLFVVGVGRALTSPVRSAIVPQVVPAEALANAVTWNSSAWQMSNMIGPALSGAVIALAGYATPAYAIAACGYMVCATLISTLRLRPFQRVVESVSLATLLAGLSFVWNTPLILATITLDLFAVLLGGATALLPIYSESILHVGAAGLGWLRSAPFVGALLMGLIMAHRPPLKRAGRALLVSVAGFGLATIVFGLSENFWLSLAMLGLVGALDNVSVIVRGTLVQLLTPDPMRGRVSAVNSIFIVSSNELGAFESGMVASALGPVFAVVSGGIGTIAVVGWVMLHWPQVLRLGPLDNPTGELYPEAAEEEVLANRSV